MTKLEKLQRRKAKVEAEIFEERKRLLPIRLKELLQGFEAINDYESSAWARSIRSMIETPSRVSTVWPFEKWCNFCYKNDIPIKYENVGDEYRGDCYDNIRIDETWVTWL